MTEKEKCRLGLLYDANYDPEILADRERAKELLYDYNRLRLVRTTTMTLVTCRDKLMPINLLLQSCKAKLIVVSGLQALLLLLTESL